MLNFRLLLSVITLLVLSQCSTNNDNATQVEQSKINIAFAGYISAYTSGVISNESSIIIEFAEPIIAAKVGEEIEDKLFEFSPTIDGKATWISNKVIEFQPTSLIPSATVYKSKFYLSKIIETVPSELETLQFQFQTMKQHLRVDYEGVKAYDPTNLSWQKIIGTLTTSDFAENLSIEKIVTATQEDKSLIISWNHQADGRSHNFIIDSVRRSEKQEEVLLNWDGSTILSEDIGSETITISPLGNFELVNIEVAQQPEQYITLYFSDPVSTSQDLSGLIYLKSGDNLRLKVDGNLVKAYPTTKLVEKNTIKIEQGVRNSMNYQLIKRYEKSIVFTNIKPSIELIGNGVILPNADGLIFPFKSVNLSAINVKIIKVFKNNIPQYLQSNQLDGTNQLNRVGRIVYSDEVPLTSEKPITKGDWSTYSLDLSKLINTDPGAIYRVVLSFTQKQSIYPCDDNAESNEDEVANQLSQEETVFDSPDGYYSDYYYNYNYYDGYRWDERDDPCKKSYYMRGQHIAARNVLVSNLGIIAKGVDNSKLVVAVTDLTTASSLPSVSVDVYNYQNQLIASGLTNSEGLVSIALDKKPFLLIASKGKEKGYLRLDDGSSLSLSMFDVSGEETKKGLKGFIYGERGVWRPGDSLFLSFILEDKLKALPESHPVVFELYTPENQLYERKVRTQSINGFYNFKTSTAQDAPTGNWLAKVKVGGSSYSKTIKIESIKPNRLKINLDFGTKILKNTEPVSGKLQVKWLHGAIAKNIKADVEVVLEKGTTLFKDYTAYSFDDPAKEFYSEKEKIYDGQLNELGEATVNTNFNVKKSAPGMLNARFKVRAFEKGGDFSIDRFTMPYSAYDSYVGVKTPEGKGWNKALYSNEPNLISIVTVTENGKPIDRKKLKIEVFEINWRWWWHRSNDNDLARYVADRSTNLLKTDYVDTKNGKVIYEMNLGVKSWGRKLIRITDPVSGHSTGSIFYTTYKGWWNNSDTDSPGGAEMLTFTTDKEKYNVGETVKINLPTLKNGRSLISIESGAKIIKTFWVDNTEEHSSFTFKTTPEMAPNVYVNVSYIQPHNNTSNDLPIRMYGINRILVEDATTHLEPIITMPKVLAPEESVTIKVSEKSGKKMTYTLAMVDEGLLDLTRFKTPDAWRKFYANEALGVKTWDMYKYVLGAYTGEIAGLLAVGGDRELKTSEDGKKANRFKPVVKFFGPIVLEAGEETTHTFIMPNYVGSVKTMLVAGYNGAYGKISKVTPVKKPVMVLATMPRVVGPTEKLKLPVTVFSMDKAIKNVSIEIQTNNLLTIKGNSKQTISFSEMGDKMAYFDLAVSEKIGIATVKVIAKSGKYKAEYNVELDVRLPNPRITKTIDGIIEPGKTWTSNYQPIGVEGTNNGVVEVSSIPSLNLEKRLKYLIRYPHGCIEQTTSAIFPQLRLASLTELSNQQKKDIVANIEVAIKKISTFQNSEGGLSYWPGETNYYSDWGTNYAGHFMIEAKTKGYVLPVGFLKKWAKYQKKRANEWNPVVTNHNKSYYRSNQLIQAYRLYTLALANQPALGAMNRMREITNLTTATKWRLAAAYQLAGREKVAEKLIKNLTTTITPYQEMSYSYGSNVRDQAMVLEALVQMDKKILAKKVFDELVDIVGSNRWYSTQTTAYTLLAISKFIGDDVADSANKLDFEITSTNTSKLKVTSELPISNQDLKITKAKSGKVTIINNGTKPLFVKIQLDGIPVTGDKTDAANDLRLDITYFDLDGNTIDPASLYQGTDFVAQVTVQHLGVRNDYKEMALTQIFPSGWEIHNVRMDQTNSFFEVDKPRYQDIRDDRVLSYFDLNRGKAKTFTVLLNAAYLGKFYLPTVYCEAMYDNEINAHKAGKWVEVIE